MNKSATPGWLVQCTCWAVTLAGTLILSAGSPADVLTQPNGWRVFQGLTLKETAGMVKFRCIWQNPGERTKLGPVTTFARDEIRRYAPLDARERAELEARLERLKPAAEAERMEKIELQPAPWRGQANAGLTYASDHFVLTSNAREDIVRRVAVRLDQIYEAYARYLPPRWQNATRTQILLVRSTAEYRQILRKQAVGILNLFQTLFHEAFHAYLANYVYPPGENDVPCWLNEGLAQIFETAILEAGELRVGHADPERLKHVKEALRKEQLVAVADLLKADSSKFLVSHANDQQVSDDYYLGSWALAFYVTFGQWKLGTPELDAYVCSSRNRPEPLEAFSRLVGQPPPTFEESFRRYLRALRADGSTTR